MDDTQCRRHRESECLEVKKTKRHENIFEYSVGGGKTGHPAVFPEALARDHILTWSNEGDTILDPFMGSGTVGVVCTQTNRNFIGVEISENYFDIAKERIDNVFSQ